ncbi:IS200/IS605 family transposase [Vreelandella rituensis]|uniref:IS200/IS605 family transposase n=1 Tax=Vreelandella rituensis TaxID=2282306 RepID=A0A368TZ38_9GAMM|nr:IS200/IS605 family transposase [Halomonas rituensis]RCV89596.1 IS200/IS605 family transposase [Halomonas rituensis]
MSKASLRSHPHCVFNLKRHLVLVTAYRQEVITSAIMEDLEIHIRRVCEMSDVGVLEFSGETDHVHVLLELHPSVMPDKRVNSIKTVTSRRIRKDHWETIKTQLWGERFWSRSYCMLSVSDGANTEIIKRYIQNQARPS